MKAFEIVIDAGNTVYKEVLFAKNEKTAKALLPEKTDVVRVKDITDTLCLDEARIVKALENEGFTVVERNFIAKMIYA